MFSWLRLCRSDQYCSSVSDCSTRERCINKICSSGSSVGQLCSSVLHSFTGESYCNSKCKNNFSCIGSFCILDDDCGNGEPVATKNANTYMTIALMSWLNMCLIWPLLKDLRAPFVCSASAGNSPRTTSSTKLFILSPTADWTGAATRLSIQPLTAEWIRAETRLLDLTLTLTTTPQRRVKQSSSDYPYYLQPLNNQRQQQQHWRRLTLHR